jgi:pyruvate,water dikinase
MNLVTDRDNPTHMRSDPEVRWSRVNCSEAQPGVVRPLCWDFVCASINRGWGEMLRDFGLIQPGDTLPWDAETGYLGVFFGRTAIGINMVESSTLLFPDYRTGDMAKEYLSQDLSAGVRVAGHKIDLERHHTHRAALLRIIEDEDRALCAWWREQTAPQAVDDLEGASGRYVDAQRRYQAAQKNHHGNSSVFQHVYSAVARLCDEAGLAHLLPKLSTGYGETIDTQAVSEMWRVRRGEITMDEFLASFGYYCSSGDDLAAESWRENPKPLRALVETYARMGDPGSFSQAEHERMAERKAAEAAVIAALPAERGAEARAVFEELENRTRVREVGKAAYKKAIDVGRAAARSRGRLLARLGALDEPNDIFFLTEAEAIHGPVSDFRAVVAERKATFERYSALEVPMNWVGEPVPEAKAPPPAPGAAGTEVQGLGVSPGCLEGRARIVLDQDAAEPMEPGDILVTRTTEPSWAPFFAVAGGVVIDIGGRLSHGAMIARELGIPCVINTGDGTARLGDGDWVRVDGDQGVVTVLRRAEGA